MSGVVFFIVLFFARKICETYGRIIMKHFHEYTPEELYQLGREIGELSQLRPDIVRRIMLGVRDGVNDTGSGISMGFVLEYLWRRWHHHIADTETPPPIPFASLLGPSGSGKLRSE